MVIYRTIFQAKFGKANELVAALKEAMGGLTTEQLETLQPRILTDISGPFDTIEMDTVHESLAAVEQFRIAVFAQNAANDEPSAMEGLIKSGRNEYYTLES